MNNSCFNSCVIATPRGSSLLRISESPSVNNLSGLLKKQQSPLPDIRSQSRLKLLSDTRNEV